MLTTVLGLVVAVSLAAHLGSAALAAARFRPFITLLRPVNGLDAFDLETLASSFAQDDPRYEVIFCAASSDDPACAPIRTMIAAHLEVPARLLVGETRLSGNPKLNNLAKGVAPARADWMAMADANLRLAPDYLAGLVDSRQGNTGLVSGPALGDRAENLWGAVECAFLNTSRARWQLAADALDLGLAQGKTLFWSRRVLEAGGGLARLGPDMAEDVSATKLVRAQELKMRLPRKPSVQPVGQRSLKAVWQQQLRWSRVRRDGFAGLFAAEIAQAPVLGFASLLALAVLGAGPTWMAAVFLILWYGAEAGFARDPRACAPPQRPCGDAVARHFAAGALGRHLRAARL